MKVIYSANRNTYFIEARRSYPGPEFSTRALAEAYKNRLKAALATDNMVLYNQLASNTDPSA